MGFLGNFFAEMGNTGVELFEMSWVQSVVLFFSYLAWALYGTGLVVACFECGIEYSSGRGNVKEIALNAIKGFMAVSLFTVVPVRLYELSVTLQASLTAGITGYGTSIGEAATEIVNTLSDIDSLTGMTSGSYFGFASITSPIMLLFCIILMAYAVIKVFFANLKRGGILLIQIAVGSLYMFSVPRGYACVQHYALNAIDLMAGNLKAHYWLVVSTYHLGSIALAKNELLRAKEILTSEEYTILEDYLRKSEVVSWEKLIK